LQSSWLLSSYTINLLTTLYFSRSCAQSLKWSFLGISTLFEWYVVRCSSKSKYQKDTFLKHWTMCSKNDNHSRLDDQHIWGDPYDCLMSSRILSLVMNKMFIRAPKIIQKVPTTSLRVVHSLLYFAYLWIQDLFIRELFTLQKGL
jgi:hypothetical protein